MILPKHITLVVAWFKVLFAASWMPILELFTAWFIQVYTKPTESICLMGRCITIVLRRRRIINYFTIRIYNHILQSILLTVLTDPAITNLNVCTLESVFLGLMKVSTRQIWRLNLGKLKFIYWKIHLKKILITTLKFAYMTMWENIKRM